MVDRNDEQVWADYRNKRGHFYKVEYTISEIYNNDDYRKNNNYDSENDNTV